MAFTLMLASPSVLSPLKSGGISQQPLHFSLFSTKPTSGCCAARISCLRDYLADYIPLSSEKLRLLLWTGDMQHRYFRQYAKQNNV
jgi:hypothetical protein